MPQCYCCFDPVDDYCYYWCPYSLICEEDTYWYEETYGYPYEEDYWMDYWL